MNRIEVFYHRITKIKPKEAISEHTEYAVWDYTESLIVDRNSESMEHIQNIGTGCSVTRRYKVEGGIESLLDDLDIDTLFEHIEGNPPDVFENPLESKDYTIKVVTKKGIEKVIQGTYDKKGLPDDWAEFMESVFDFMTFYGWGEIMNPAVYGKVRRCGSDIIYCSVTFDEGYKSYYYIADDDSIEVGDYVIVPAGKDNHEAVVAGFVHTLWVFFFHKPLEQCGVIACAVGHVVQIDRSGDQPVHADILSGDHIAVSAVSQFLVLRDMAGQRKPLQTGQRIQNQIGDIPRGIWPHKVQVKHCDFFKFPLGGFRNHKVSHADKSPPAVFWIPPAYRWGCLPAGLPLPPFVDTPHRIIWRKPPQMVGIWENGKKIYKIYMEDISRLFPLPSTRCEQTQMCVYCGRNQRGGKRAADILADLSNTDAEPGNCS